MQDLKDKGERGVLTMTIDDKRDVVRAFCNKQTDCRNCPCNPLGVCYSYNEDTAPDNEIERWYDCIVSHTDEPTEEIVENIDLAPTPADNVNHPSHYETGKFECIDVMIETQGVEAVMNFCICNALKYLYRHKRKNGVEDIRKARWYIDKYLELWEEQECLDTPTETEC